MAGRGNERTNVGWRVDIASKAVGFFSPQKHSESLKAIGKTDPAGTMVALSGSEFMKFLKHANWDPWPLATQIQRILSQLVGVGILIQDGRKHASVLGETYWTLGGITEAQATGNLWLSSALGPELIIPSYGSITFRLTGINKVTKQPGVGSGLVLSDNILTCAHVAAELELDEFLELPKIMPPIIYGLAPWAPCRVITKTPHEHVDVAIVEVEGKLPILGGVAWRDPEWADRVSIFGFPPIPLAKEGVLAVQAGEIVTPAIETLHGQDVFLYSAIARPGNSGGPIVGNVGNDGRVLGIVSTELTASPKGPAGAGHIESPFYAGVPTREIRTALEEMDLGHLIVFESWQ
jgi:hypothetical protein